uniref:Uncharacterized protein n=1 Tax=Arundo donax TaxID=35708 RepID=A0A0A9ECB4_ARUDO
MNPWMNTTSSTASPPPPVSFFFHMYVHAQFVSVRIIYVHDESFREREKTCMMNTKAGDEMMRSTACHVW